MLSPAGAQGHFQFMPDTAKQYGLADPNDLPQSADAAGRYFRDLSGKYGGDVRKMLAAYNWGPSNVDRKGLEKMPAETRDYVETIAPQLAQQGMAAKVAAAKKEGYTDQEIFNYLANSEKHSAKIAAAKKEGYTEAEIAKHLGLKFDDLTGATASRYPSSSDVASAPKSGWQNFGTGLTKSVLDTVQGLPQLVQEASTPKGGEVNGVKLTGLVSPLLTGISAARGLANAYGVPVGDPRKEAALLKQAVTDRHAEEAPAMNTWQGIAGNATGTIAQMMAGGAGSPTLKEWLLVPDKAYKAMAGGAAYGFTQATGEGENRAANAAVSGIGATLGYGAGVAIGKVYNSVKNYVTAFAKTGSQDALNQAAEQILQQGFSASKVPMKDVSPDVMAGLKKQIQEALAGNSNPSPDVVARMIDFAALNIKGTKGQLTRDPTQWANEFNLRQINRGEPNALMQQYTDASSKLSNKLQAMGAKTERDPFATGQVIIDAVQKADAVNLAELKALYDAAKDSTGRYAQMDTAGFSKQANDFLDKEMVGKFLPTEMREVLNDISSGKIPFNVNTMQQYQTLLGQALRKAQSAKDGNAATAIKGVINALNDAGIATTEGAATKASFDAARKAARARFASLEASPGLSAAVDNVAPDNFFKNFILNPNAKVREVQEMLKYLGQGAKEATEAGPNKLMLPGPEGALLLPGPQQAANNPAIGAIREEMLSHLLEKLTKGQASYAEALKAIGDQKLALLLPEGDVAMLKVIQRTAEALDKAPKGAVPNRSGTTAAAINMLHDLITKFSNLPGANIAKDSVKKYGETKAAESALKNPLMDPVITQLGNQNRLLSGFGAAAGTGASQR